MALWASQSNENIISAEGFVFSDIYACTNKALVSYIWFSFLIQCPHSSCKPDCLVSFICFREDFSIPASLIGFYYELMDHFSLNSLHRIRSKLDSVTYVWTCFTSSCETFNFPSCWAKNVNTLAAKTWQKAEKSEEEQWSIEHVDTDGCSKHYYSLMRLKINSLLSICVDVLIDRFHCRAAFILIVWLEIPLHTLCVHHRRSADSDGSLWSSDYSRPDADCASKTVAQRVWLCTKSEWAFHFLTQLPSSNLQPSQK